MNALGKLVSEIENQIDISLEKSDFEMIEKVWNSIKDNADLLKEAIKVVRAKAGGVRFNSDKIVHLILGESDNTLIYCSLVDIVLSDSSLATNSVGNIMAINRILLNHDLVLTEEQKNKIIDIALNFKYTLKYYSELNERSQGKDKDTSEKIKNRINQKYYSDRNLFDIRYYVLENPNFASLRKKLVNMFFPECTYQITRDLYAPLPHVGEGDYHSYDLIIMERLNEILDRIIGNSYYNGVKHDISIGEIYCIEDYYDFEPVKFNEDDYIDNYSLFNSSGIIRIAKKRNQQYLNINKDLHNELIKQLLFIRELMQYKKPIWLRDINRIDRNQKLAKTYEI